MATYRGDRTLDGLEVRADDELLDTRSGSKAFSENGFEWGYEGDEPRQLAFAILSHFFDDDEQASKHADAFMRGVVANFNNEWEMTADDISVALKNLGCT